MFLAVILYCSAATDTSTCDVMIRKDYLFETIERCEYEMNTIAQGLIGTGHYVKGKCFTFNPFGETT